MTPPRTDRLVAACGGTVVTLKALRRYGVARSTVAYRCRAGGPWQSLLPGVILLHNGSPTRADRRRAALLYCDESAAARPVNSEGPSRSVLTGLDALELHGLRRIPSPSGPVHLLVPVDVRRVGGGRLLVERTTRLPRPVPGRWPIAPVAREDGCGERSGRGAGGVGMGNGCAALNDADPCGPGPGAAPCGHRQALTWTHFDPLPTGRVVYGLAPDQGRADPRALRDPNMCSGRPGARAAGSPVRIFCFRVSPGGATRPTSGEGGAVSAVLRRGSTSTTSTTSTSTRVSDTDGKK